MVNRIKKKRAAYYILSLVHSAISLVTFSLPGMINLHDNSSDNDLNTLETKGRYILNYRNLQQRLDLGINWNTCIEF
jgi:hypothetical protein